MAPETLAAAALIVAGTYLVFGLTGFGSTVLALPLLAHFLPLKFAVALLLLLDMAAGLAVSSRGWRGVRLDELAWVLPFVLAGIALGFTLLLRLPEGPLLTALAVFLLAYAAYGLARRQGLPKLSRGWSAPFGVAGGMLSALFGTGGVLIALYINSRLSDKEELRATAAAAVLLNSSARTILFGVAGLLTWSVVSSALFMLPAVALGLWFGDRLHGAIPGALVTRALYAVVALAGLSLLRRVMLS